MKKSFKTIILLLITGFIGIQFASVIDDPEHLIQPDPDCPICLAAQSPIFINPDIR